MIAKKRKEEPVWIDFEVRLPSAGQKIKVLREMEFEVMWDGNEARKVIPGAQFEWTEKTYWQSC